MQQGITMDIIRGEMNEAVREFRKKGTGFINIRQGMHHHDLTEVLHEFVYKEGKPASITVRYSGKKAEPIDLCCLRSPVPPIPFESDRSIRPLRTSLISMRHLRLDHVVDIAWFLNKDLALHGTYVQQDEYCYNYTLDQLRELTHRGIRHIHLYQTGYQIALVGFYRALIKYLLNQRTNADSPSLAVTPYYFDDYRSLYKIGKTWS